MICYLNYGNLLKFLHSNPESAKQAIDVFTSRGSVSLHSGDAATALSSPACTGAATEGFSLQSLWLPVQS